MERTFILTTRRDEDRLTHGSLQRPMHLFSVGFHFIDGLPRFILYATKKIRFRVSLSILRINKSFSSNWNIFTYFFNTFIINSTYISISIKIDIMYKNNNNNNRIHIFHWYDKNLNLFLYDFVILLNIILFVVSFILWSFVQD